MRQHHKGNKMIFYPSFQHLYIQWMESFSINYFKNPSLSLILPTLTLLFKKTFSQTIKMSHHCRQWPMTCNSLPNLKGINTTPHRRQWWLEVWIRLSLAPFHFLFLVNWPLFPLDLFISKISWFLLFSSSDFLQHSLKKMFNTLVLFEWIQYATPWEPSWIWRWEQSTA